MTCIKQLSATFALHQDQNAVIKMAAYMKNQFNFFGISAPKRAELSKDFIFSLRDASRGDLHKFCKTLWSLDQREFQYTAIAVLASQHKRLNRQDLDEMLELVGEKSWWDTVDGLISVFSKVLRRLPENEVESFFGYCYEHDDLWYNRVAILYQLGWRAKIDKDRLFATALNFSHHPNFFIKKAIGWALRDMAKLYPIEVQIFVTENRNKLSALSIREALKNIKLDK